MNSETKPTILLIEDDHIIAQLLTDRLTRSGYTVSHEVDGREGLEAAKAVPPDLLLLDLMLPSLDGFSILRELQKEHITPGLPVIVISNSGQPVEVERILEMGARDYLVKVNLKPMEVIEKVRGVLEA